MNFRPFIVLRKFQQLVNICFFFKCLFLQKVASSLGCDSSPADASSLFGATAAKWLRNCSLPTNGVTGDSDFGLSVSSSSPGLSSQLAINTMTASDETASFSARDIGMSFSSAFVCSLKDLKIKVV